MSLRLQWVLAGLILLAVVAAMIGGVEFLASHANGWTVR